MYWRQRTPRFAFNSGPTVKSLDRLVSVSQATSNAPMHEAHACRNVPHASAQQWLSVLVRNAKHEFIQGLCSTVLRSTVCLVTFLCVFFTFLKLLPFSCCIMQLWSAKWLYPLPLRPYYWPTVFCKSTNILQEPRYASKFHEAKTKMHLQ